MGQGAKWDLGHPPQKTERPVRVHVVFTLLMFALATAYRLQCERAALGGEPVGWPRWRRQLLEQTRGKVIVFAQGSYGIFHIAEDSLLLRAKLKDVPQVSGHASKFWPHMDSPGRADSHVGTSVLGRANRLGRIASISHAASGHPSGTGDLVHGRPRLIYLAYRAAHGGRWRGDARRCSSSAVRHPDA
jgi:hypothetical protein